MMNKITAFLKAPFIRKYANYLAIVLAALVFGALSLTGNVKMGTQFLMEQIAIAALLAVSLGMVVGFLGELSLGHAGFMCAGAYLGGKVAQLLTASSGNGNSILTLAFACIAGGIAAAVLGFVIGLPALRLRGDYLAIVTLAFGEIVRNVIMNLPAAWFGGTS